MNRQSLQDWLRYPHRLLKRWFGPKPISVTGPLEQVDGVWMLRLPLAVGGRELIDCTKGISTVKGDVLEIRLPEKLVQNLKLSNGQKLSVNNNDGEFTFEWGSELPSS